MKELFSQILYYPFLNILTFFIWSTPGHYAAAGIVLLTLFVRIILIIPSKRAAEGQRKLMELQPLMDELKAEYKDDQASLATAQMELYKNNGVNPFSSCGLALIQLPVLYILYVTILHGLSANSPHLYAWLPRPEFINTNFFGISLVSPDHTYILPVIAAALQFVQTRMTLPPKPKNGVMDPQQAMQQNVMYVFPLVTLFIAQRFPAGVALYWVVSNGFSILQQRSVNKKKFALNGVEAVVNKAEKAHTERKAALEKAERQVLDQSTGKGGVSVTVRKKK